MEQQGLIGFVGLGAMGAPMVHRLAEQGHRLRAFDISEERREAVARPGVDAVGTAGEAADGVDALGIMVATPAQLETVLFGPDGAAAQLSPGSTVIVFATVGPDAVRNAATRLAELGVALLDAPVSGGVVRAGDGELLIMVGGEPGDLGPLLDDLGSAIAACGPAVGDGQTMKIINQLVCGVHIAVTAEALSFAEALGVDPQQAYQVLSEGAAQSFMLVDRGKRMLADVREGDVKSALDIFVKDMRLVTDCANDLGLPLPLATVANDIFKMGHGVGLGRLDDAAIVELYRSWADERPRSVT